MSFVFHNPCDVNKHFFCKEIAKKKLYVYIMQKKKSLEIILF